MPGEMPMVGGAEMDPREDIVVNLSKASDMSTLVAAIKAAELDKTLAGAGPFTVFAPNNAAFEKLPEGAVDDLLRPEHKQKLSAIVTYHVLPADMTLEDALKAVAEDGGSHSVMTIEGESLTLTSENGTLVLDDARGEKASVVQSDVAQSNGMVHVIDTVLMPE
ncbi:fasciclin domain-containing protein [Fulvimarina endophytica]|uniref:Fasciclin domain-containing protein n=2 Tax=Fulvimarina endophytica TaxID=2293836 RepID=A0A371X1Q5_9HYPH|nr:fasciclin domain-containing protein [Fulvimarina endophytica]